MKIMFLENYWQKYDYYRYFLKKIDLGEHAK